MTSVAITPDEMIARAAAIAPTLVARQAETEQRTCYAPDTHEQFREAGLYRMLVPRRYGGYELDVPTFVRVIAHLARGCPSTAWQVCLPTAHALLVASWFDERAQDELFADPDFLCPSVAAPVGRARKIADGFLELTGTHRYCSGAPYATHYLGQTLPAGPDPDGPPAGPPMLFVAPRSAWTMLDDWGHTLGLKGSGSNSIVFDAGRIPEYFALPDTQMLDVDNSDGTPGQRLHGNPMYFGRALSFFGLEFIALAVGMVKGALDEYLELITTRTTHRPPIILRSHDPDYQRWYGRARAKTETAEAALLQAADQWMEACRGSCRSRASACRAARSTPGSGPCRRRCCWSRCPSAPACCPSRRASSTRCAGRRRASVGRRAGASGPGSASRTARRSSSGACR